MTAITIRMVIVEHNPTDMELIQHELKKTILICLCIGMARMFRNYLCLR
jgi:hypothetical protein